MPWTTADVEGFKKGLSKKQKKKWVAVANGALESCMESGGSDKDCAGRAVRIANSKFEERTPFNSVLKAPPKGLGNFPPPVGRMLRKALDEYGDMKTAWDVVHAAGWYRNEEGNWMKGEKSSKKFQHTKKTPPDPRDGHFHTAAFDEDGNGGTDEAGDMPHTHQVYGFKTQPYYYYENESRKEYVSVHPGSLAFEETPEMKARMKKCKDSGKTEDECIEAMKKEMAELGEVEMEIFRAGTHNGDEFKEEDLEEIAANFQRLRDELRPKLKITHRENQETLAGLASYGDVVDVFLKKVADGTRRLFAKVANVPREVMDFIKERRFPERSIELYPEFKLGTKEGSPVFKNVLKAIALLGSEMPAVTGMDPIKLEECIECQGTSCFRQNFSTEGKPSDKEAPAELALAFRMTGEILSKTRGEVIGK